jgi:RecA-family ATPase
MDIEETVWHKANTEQNLPEHEIQNWNNLFNLKPANAWMENAGKKPLPKALFGDFWLEGELSMLFSDTNRGKSTLAVQIAEALARGVSIAPFEAVPSAQKVLYLDFELTDRQFEARYSTVGEDGKRSRYRFSDDLLRAQTSALDHLPPGFETMAEFIHHSFVALVRETGARIVIVDNITFLKGANENASAAAQLMKALKHLKEYYSLSILVLAHTPKLSFTSPLSLNHMQGSKMLSNFADNVFVIGASSQAKDLRYLKHLKPRGGEIRFDASNVILYRIKKADSFLQFEFAGYAKERDHLVWHYDYSDGERAELMIVAKRLYAQGASQRRVAMIMGVSHTTVRRYLMAATPGDENILKEDDVRRLKEEQEENA